MFIPDNYLQTSMKISILVFNLKSCLAQQYMEVNKEIKYLGFLHVSKIIISTIAFYFHRQHGIVCFDVFVILKIVSHSQQLSTVGRMLY